MAQPKKLKKYTTGQEGNPHPLFVPIKKPEKTEKTMTVSMFDGVAILTRLTTSTSLIIMII
jgi:hypothetical protein